MINFRAEDIFSMLQNYVSACNLTNTLNTEETKIVQKYVKKRQSVSI